MTGVLWLLLALSVVWSQLMRNFGGADVYSVMGPFSLAVVAVLGMLVWRRDAEKTWLKLNRRVLAVGVGVGLVMTLGTYAAYRLTLLAFPSLDGVVKTLYAFAHVERLPVAFVMTVFILVAEELLWRGLLVDELRAFMPRALSEACSVLIYAFAQLGSGSFIVFALAVVCGSIWTAERRVTGSLLAPLISHLIWTPTVILLWPVT